MWTWKIRQKQLGSPKLPNQRLATACLVLLFTLGWGASPPALRAQTSAKTDQLTAWRATLRDLTQQSENLHLHWAKAEADSFPVLRYTAGDSLPTWVWIAGLDGYSLWTPQLAMGMLRQWLQDPSPQLNLLVIPWVNTPALRRRIFAPSQASAYTAGQDDADRDFRQDEDGPDDLDGDGQITQLWLPDAAGDFRPAPYQAQLLIPAEPTTPDSLRYRRLPEGLDNDGDYRYNEDPPGRWDLTRQFSYGFEPEWGGAGLEALRDPFARRLADILFAEQSLQGALVLGREANLLEPWKPRSPGQDLRTTSGPNPSDAEQYTSLADGYRQAFPNFPTAESHSPTGGGVLGWLHAHRGCWALGTPGWRLPKLPESFDNLQQQRLLQWLYRTTQPDTLSLDSTQRDSLFQHWRSEIPNIDTGTHYLLWAALNGLDAPRYTPATPVPQPPEPGALVGGLHPGALREPPLNARDSLVKQHAEWFRNRIADPKPQFRFAELEVRKAGENLYRLEVEVVNTGRLPVFNEAGAALTWYTLPVVELRFADSVQFLSGYSRQTLQGPWAVRESRQLTYLLHSPKPVSGKLVVGAPHVGWIRQRLRLD